MYNLILLISKKKNSKSPSANIPSIFFFLKRNIKKAYLMKFLLNNFAYHYSSTGEPVDFNCIREHVVLMKIIHARHSPPGG